MCTEHTIQPAHLPPSLLAEVRTARTRTPSAGAPQVTAGVAQPNLQAEHPNLQAEMKAIERSRILAAMERCGGNQSEVARQLGMPRRTLVSRLTEFGLTRRQVPDHEA